MWGRLREQRGRETLHSWTCGRVGCGGGAETGQVPGKHIIKGLLSFKRSVDFSLGGFLFLIRTRKEIGWMLCLLSRSLWLFSLLLLDWRDRVIPWKLHWSKPLVTFHLPDRSFLNCSLPDRSAALLLWKLLLRLLLSRPLFDTATVIPPVLFFRASSSSCFSCRSVYPP